MLEVDRNAREPRPSVLTSDNQLRRIGVHDLDGPVSPVTRIRIPKSFNAKVPPKSRRDLASSMRHAISEDAPPHSRRNSRHEDFGLGARLPDQEKKIADLRRALRLIRAMAAANAKTMHGGRSVGGSCGGRPMGWSGRSKAGRIPSPRLSTASAMSCPSMVTWKATTPDTSPSASTGSGFGGSTVRRTCSYPRLCGAVPSTTSTPPNWPRLPAPWFTKPNGKTVASGPGCPALPWNQP